MKSQVAPEKFAEDAQSLAKELVRQKKLTLFQANPLYNGKPNGLILGNFVVLDRIGAGAMGIVFESEHRRMKRVVAVKVLSPAAIIVAAHDADEY